MVNGSLEYLAKDLGIVENTALQGKELFVNSSMEILFVGNLPVECVDYLSLIQENRECVDYFSFNLMKQRMSFAELV